MNAKDALSTASSSAATSRSSIPKSLASPADAWRAFTACTLRMVAVTASSTCVAGPPPRALQPSAT
ncbi:MAG: hypothetical protein ACK4NM_18680, partial [Hydrogenophaga sp.]